MALIVLQSDFIIRPENFNSGVEAIRLLALEAIKYRFGVSSRRYQELGQEAEFLPMLLTLAELPIRESRQNNSGSIAGLFLGIGVVKIIPKHREIFDALAPFVEDGGYILLYDYRFNDLVLWRFRAGKIEVEMRELIW